MSRLLLLEAMGNTGAYLIRAAAGLGQKVTVVTHEDIYRKFYTPELKKLIGEDIVFTDFSDVDGCRDQLATYSRSNQVSGVLCGWEFLSPLVAELAAELELPGNDPVRALGCRNKRVMAELFAQFEVPSPRTILASTYESAVEQIAAHGQNYPLVVKPAEQSASWGVSVVRAPEQLAAAFELARSWPMETPHYIALDTTVIVQEYVGGVEYSVEAIASRGRVMMLPVTEKFTTQDSYRVETGHTVPAVLPNSTLDTIRSISEQALRALGVHNGVAHIELKIQTDGSARIIEVGARLPGDHVVRLMKEACGIDEARAYIQAVTGVEPETTPLLGRAAAIRFFTSYREGTFNGLTGIGSSPHVVETVTAEPGTPVGGVRSKGNDARVGHTLLIADSTGQVNAAAEAVMARVTVEVS
ncbi:ATP-grasp domain-containing protein [Streptomyces sp. NPDC048383]|uniref:ATP-grasp domain-containing protein n=1 Tax=Streptomyces sp. NPDC048383 TaxID=3155386 RepID=UPI00343C96A6